MNRHQETDTYDQHPDHQHPDHRTTDQQMKPYPDEHGPRAGETIVLLHGGNMGGWTWGGQVEALPGRHLLTPDLPGYGQQASIAWPGPSAAADDVARTIRERAIGGRAHVVGLSLGGHTALFLLQQHPDLVLSCAVSGVAALGLGRFEALMVGVTVPAWHRRWFWSLQSYAFRIPAKDRQLFVNCASAPLPITNRRLFSEARDGAMPQGPIDYDGPFLAVAGEREAGSVERAFPVLRAALPQTQTWVAPRMHHAWSAEDPGLFTRMVTTFADTGRWP